MAVDVDGTNALLDRTARLASVHAINCTALSYVEHFAVLEGAVLSDVRSLAVRVAVGERSSPPGEFAVREQPPMNDRPLPEPRAARIRHCAAELFASGLLDCDNTLLDNDLVEDIHDRSNP